MALTVTQLAEALRVDVADADELAIVTRLFRTSGALVEKMAPGAPDAIKEECQVRISGYLLDQPTSPRGAMFSSAMRNSGAAAMLRDWRVFGAVSTDANDENEETGGVSVITVLDGQAATGQAFEVDDDTTAVVVTGPNMSVHLEARASTDRPWSFVDGSQFAVGETRIVPTSPGLQYRAVAAAAGPVVQVVASGARLL